MRRANLRVLAFLIALGASTASAQQLMNVPVRINMGGAETVDSFGRIWLGDGPGPGDPLGIRPDDAGGAESAENWSAAAFQSDSLDALGFDSTHPGDSYIFNTIRWDVGNAAPDFLIEIPVPESSYTVNLYFNEGCCPDRHFKIEIQGTIVDDDVSYLDYDVANPALGRAGVLSFVDQVVGPDKLLKIVLLPCNVVDCPGVLDTNAIVDAVEVISGPRCDHLGLDFNCLYRGDTGDAIATWNTLAGADAFRLLKNGAPLGGDLPGSANSFTDPNPGSGGPYATYQLQALDGGDVFSSCTCSILTIVCPSALACSADASGTVSLAWTGGSGSSITSYEIRRNGTLLTSLPGTATTYEDAPADERNFTYTVTPVTNPTSLCSVLSCDVVVETNLFDVPLRINMGGRETVDSRGRLWLGDGPGAGDPLGIRPDDSSGTNWIESWCAPVGPTLRDLGFDPTDANDRYILSTIRWDNGPLLNPGDASVFYMELPIPNGNEYFVNLYFNECCCPNRHFRIELQGEIVDPDVSQADYATPAGNGKVGRLSFGDVLVDTEVLRIGLLPCDPADCPGVGDDNAIINAIEVVKNPCSEVGFRQCPQNLGCTFSPLGRRTTGFWDRALCFTPSGYEVYRNGDLVNSLPGDAAGFTDVLPVGTRIGYYEVKTLVAVGEAACPVMTCSVQNTAVPFSIPLRLNMGGRFLTDSRGNKWIGDLPGAGDALEIRTDDAGGTNTIENWCSRDSVNESDSMRSLGLDPTNPNDQGIFNTIRWDVGADGLDFRLEIPVPNGDYVLNLYFTECCCFGRHFQLEVEGDLYDDDIHAGDYSSVQRLGRTGRLSFDGVQVSDNALSIGILPCPICDPTPFALDTNAIIDAIELLPSGTINKTCPRDLGCTLDAGVVTGNWIGSENVSVSGYEVYRNGVKIQDLPGSAVSFTDDPAPCERVLSYEVAPLVTEHCVGMRMRCTLFQPDCSWTAPIRINMGGAATVDSHNNLWLGDGPGGGDPLEIRSDDLGGGNWIEYWTLGLMDEASFTALGFDSTHPGDQYIFNTIRWDDGSDASNFALEFPIADGEYDVNLYFNEAGSPERHFQVEIEGVVVNDDVSYLDYDPAAPAFGKLGRLRFEKIVVADGVLNINLPPCLTCPGVMDINAIVDAIEITGGGVAPGPVFHRGDADQNGVLQLTDAIQVLGYLFLGTATRVPDCPDAADADDNGVIQLTDAVRILGYLFLGLGPPATPGPPPEACGVDPTTDDLLDPCNNFTGC